jgi:hypothetical protein
VIRRATAALAANERAFMDASYATNSWTFSDVVADSAEPLSLSPDTFAVACEGFGATGLNGTFKLLSCDGYDYTLSSSQIGSVS